MGGEVATTGGHSGLPSCVAGGHTTTATEAGCSVCNTTANLALQGTGTTDHENIDRENAVNINTKKGEVLLRSPEQVTEGFNSGNKRGPWKKLTKERLKA